MKNESKNILIGLNAGIYITTERNRLVIISKTVNIDMSITDDQHDLENADEYIDSLIQDVEDGFLESIDDIDKDMLKIMSNEHRVKLTSVIVEREGSRDSLAVK